MGATGSAIGEDVQNLFSEKLVRRVAGENASLTFEPKSFTLHFNLTVMALVIQTISAIWAPMWIWGELDPNGGI